MCRGLLGEILGEIDFKHTPSSQTVTTNCVKYIVGTEQNDRKENKRDIELR